MRRNLTAKAIEALKSAPAGGRYDVADGIVPGFGVRVTDKGKSKAKKALHAAMTEASDAPVANWTVHDLRRTARSLMSRAGVRPDVSERVLGHAIPGVEGVYDRYSYDPEKADALAKLAELVTRIVEDDAKAAEVIRVRDPALDLSLAPSSAMHADPELRRKAALPDLAVESGTAESGPV